MKLTKRIAYMAYNMTLINHNELEIFLLTITSDFHLFLDGAGLDCSPVWPRMTFGTDLIGKNPSNF